MSSASDNFWRDRRVAAITASFCCLLWGSAFPAIKVGYRLFAIDGAASQILFAGCRFLLAGILVTAVGSIIGGRFLCPRRADARPVFLLALTQTAGQYLFFYIGLAHAGGVTSSIINGAGTGITVLMTCFLFRMERMTAKKAIGCLLGLLGIVLMSLGGGQWTFSLLGEGFILISAVASGTAAILIKGFSADHDPVLLSGWQFMAGGVLLIAAGALFGGRLSPCGIEAWGILLYLGFLSAAAYTLWGLLLKHHSVSAIASYQCLIPIFGAALSAWWLAESGDLLRVETPIALFLVTAGVWMLNRPTKNASRHH